jgi:hypothetical protein
MRIKPLLLSLLLAVSLTAASAQDTPKPQDAPKCFTVDNIRDLIKLARESGSLTQYGYVLSDDKKPIRYYVLFMPADDLADAKIGLVKEIWTKDKDGKDHIDQWLIELSPVGIKAMHQELVEKDRIILETNKLSLDHYDDVLCEVFDKFLNHWTGPIKLAPGSFGT